MSLSGKILEGKINNIGGVGTVADPPEPLPLHVIEDNYSELLSCLSVGEKEPCYDHILFVSDMKITDEVKTSLLTFPNVRNFDENFINRNCKDLFTAKIDHIWIDISSKQAKEWLQLNVKNCDPFLPILVYKGSKRSKFVDDLEEHVETVCRLKDLKKLRALNFEDMIGQMSNMVSIHSPANALMDCLGFSKNTKSKNV